MRRTIAAAVAASAAVTLVSALAGPGARAATPQTASATAALRYLYAAEQPDGSVDGSAGVTEDTVIGTADNGYDPATLRTAGGASALAYLGAQVSGGKITTPGGAAKLILAWVAAGRPASIDGAAVVTRLNTATGSGGFLQPNGSWLAAKGFGNGFTQALGVLADVAAGATLPANATGWLLCAQQPDGGFIDQIDPSGSAPPTTGTCGTTSDTNDTGLALQALDAAGVTSANAAARGYLAGAQQADGGFGFDASSGSDPDSDAVVVEGLVAIGEDPAGAAWTKSGRNPLTNLATFETPPGSGGYAFAAGSPADAFTTSVIPAALALKPYASPTSFTAGRSPVAAAPTPTPAATPAATAPPTPAPTPAPVVSPPATGGGPGGDGPGAAGPLAAAAAAAALGLAWRRRRR